MEVMQSNSKNSSFHSTAFTNVFILAIQLFLETVFLFTEVEITLLFSLPLFFPYTVVIGVSSPLPFFI